MIRATIIALSLAACSQPISPEFSDVPAEVVDQGLHAATGYALAWEIARTSNADNDTIEAAVMAYAEARENLQHPGTCGEGCQRDLRYWREGVRAALRRRPGQ
jgi:hypothetical protein